MRFKRVFRHRVAAALLVAGLAVASAVSADDAAGDWRQTAVLYGMGAAIDGTAQIGPVVVPVDLSISDVFDKLKFGFMGAYAVDNGTWAFSGDLTFMTLGVTQTFGNRQGKGEIDLDQITFMVTAGRRISEHFEVLGSLAYLDLSTELTVRGPLGNRQQANVDVDWIDPAIGLRYVVPFGDRWRFTLRGDVGGFGVGSELLVQLLTHFHWQQSERIGWLIGYRVIDFDYEDGNGASYQRFDLTQQGPAVGVSISF